MHHYWDCYKMKIRNNFFFASCLYFLQFNFLDLNINLQLQNMTETE